jgi:hypothetical protein
MGNNIYALCCNNNQTTAGKYEWRTQDDKENANKAAFMIQYSYKNLKARSELTKRQNEIIQEFDLNVSNHGRYISEDEMLKHIDPNILKIEKIYGPFRVTTEEMQKFKNVFDRPPILFNDGSIYKGQWNYSGNKHGYGVYIDRDGSKYEGYFVNGNISGRGRFINTKGDFYEGKIY